MKTYYVFSHSTKGIRIVKLGFSWPALLFSFWWAFLKGLNGTGAILLFIWLCAAAASYQNPNNFAVMLFFYGLFIILSIVLAFQVNSWRRSKLERHGFLYLGKIQATSYRKARKKYINDGAET
jgi:hypothetical protein